MVRGSAGSGMVLVWDQLSFLSQCCLSTDLALAMLVMTVLVLGTVIVVLFVEASSRRFCYYDGTSSQWGSRVVLACLEVVPVPDGTTSGPMPVLMVLTRQIQMDLFLSCCIFILVVLLVMIMLLLEVVLVLILLVLGTMLVLGKVLVLKHAVNMIFAGSGGSSDFGNVILVSSTRPVLVLKKLLLAGWYWFNWKQLYLSY